MNVELSPEAVDFGLVAERAIEAAGGDTLVVDAERDPEGRAEPVEAVLAGLGAWDLAPRDDAVELEAAAALCRAAGWWCVPYPVAERLARLPGEPDGLVVVSDHAPRAAVGALDREWLAVTLSGDRGVATAEPLAGSARANAFVTGLRAMSTHAGDPTDAALGLVLSGWTLLGQLDRAIDVTRRHVLDRHQFGQPLSSFQGVQFQLTEAEVERAGLEELAKYALWSGRERLDDALADALALRVAAIDAAEVVFRVAHQLHGALGFCDESVLSWLSRHSQPLRRLPFGASGTLDALVGAVGRRGLTGLFSGAFT